MEAAARANAALRDGSRMGVGPKANARARSRGELPHAARRSALGRDDHSGPDPQAPPCPPADAARLAAAPGVDRDTTRAREPCGCSTWSCNIVVEPDVHRCAMVKGLATPRALRARTRREPNGTTELALSPGVTPGAERPALLVRATEIAMRHHTPSEVEPSRIAASCAVVSGTVAAQRVDEPNARKSLRPRTGLRNRRASSSAPPRAGP